VAAEALAGTFGRFRALDARAVPGGFATVVRFAPCDDFDRFASVETTGVVEAFDPLGAFAPFAPFAPSDAFDAFDAVRGPVFGAASARTSVTGIRMRGSDVGVSGSRSASV